VAELPKETHLLFFLASNDKHYMLGPLLQSVKSLFYYLAKSYLGEISGSLGLLHTLLVEQKLESIKVDEFDNRRQMTRDELAQQVGELLQLEVFEAVRPVVTHSKSVCKVPKQMCFAGAWRSNEKNLSIPCDLTKLPVSINEVSRSRGL
jgi:hypothetical protein